MRIPLLVLALTVLGGCFAGCSTPPPAPAPAPKVVGAGYRAFAGAKAGEWTLQRDTTFRGEPSALYTYTWVSLVEGDQIAYRTQLLNEDLKTAKYPPVSGTAGKGSLFDKEEPFVEDDVTIKGRPLKCHRYERHTSSGEGKKIELRWSSPEIPCFHNARFVEKNEAGETLVESEIVDYGSSGGAEKPVR